VRNLFKQVFNVERDEDFGSFAPATAKQLEEFSLGGDGPNHNYPQWDMSGAPTSPWNEAIVDILTDRLITELEKIKPPLFPKKTRMYWEVAIREKFCRIKQEWAQAQPHITDTGQIEHANEIEERRIKYTDRRLKRTRVRERRVRVRLGSLPNEGRLITPEEIRTTPNHCPGGGRDEEGCGRR